MIDLGTPEPSIPAGLTVTESQPDSITLDWDDSSNALQYEVLRSTESDQGFQLVGAPLDSVLTDAIDLSGYETYYYIVGAIGPGGRSGFSLPFEVGPRFVPGAKPSRPKDLSLIERAPYTISLQWGEAENADAYYVYRSTMPDREFQLVDTVESTKIDDTFAIYPDQSYYYQVKGVGEGGFSLASHIFEVEPVLTGYRKMERLDRAPVAVPTEAGVLVSWRLLGTDPHDIAFNLYRDGHRLNDTPITGATNHLDAGGHAGALYEVRTVRGRVEQPGGESFGVWSQNYRSVPIQAPPGGQTPDGVNYTYSANDASVADLDGDGEYEIVLKWDPSNSKDNSQFGYTGNAFLDAYKLDGSLLWRIDLGINIRAGAHYTQFMVYDFDCDGKAELICKTADGTVDAQGTVIGDASADYRNSGGFILAGPEYLTAFNGETGAIIDTVSYIPDRHPVAGDFPTPEQIFEIWGDDYGNRIDRFLAGVAYFDGQRPSYFACRGQYRGQGGVEGRTVIAAFDLIDGQLVERWVLDSLEDGAEWAGQGHHQLSVGDADADGRDEIMYGGMVVDDDGQGLYSTEYGTGDAMHFGDFDPTRPGLEFFAVKEDGNAPVHVEFRDPATGELIWGVNNGRDTGRGLIADIDPMFPGAEAWGAANLSVWAADGSVIGFRRPSINFATWWDGDALRELTDGTSVRKWDYRSESAIPVLVATGSASNNGTKANSALQADLFGDWREEVMFRSADSTELRIYTTTDATQLRMVTLMHDPMYRLAVAWQNNGYNQPPHPSFFIGNNMPTPSWPRLYVSPVPTVLGEQTGLGEYDGKVLITLEVNQNGPFENQYRIDGDAWKTYLHPLTLNNAGTYLLEFRTLDSEGSELATSSKEVTLTK